MRADTRVHASRLAAALFAWITLCAPATALITGGRGNDPVRDAGWPTGAVDVANLESRVAWWEGPPFGGGESHFVYRGDAAAFQAALDLMAKVDAKQLLLVIHEGPQDSFWLKVETDPKIDARIDWSFTVWNADNYNRLFNDPKSTFMARDPEGRFRQPVPPPRIDVYLGGAPAGAGVEWSQVVVPANVTVTDERASANGYPAGSGSVLRGRVADLVTAKPIAGAKVVVMKYTGKGQDYEDVVSATAAADGRFEVTRVPAGSFRVHATAEGYATRLLGYAKFGADTLKQYPDARLAPPASVAGTVVASDKPIPGLDMRADNVIGPDGKGYVLLDDPRATTDAQGRFTVAGMPAGSCTLHVSGPGYQMVEPLKVQTVPAQNVIVRMTGTGNVRGRVTRNGGAPTDTAYIASLIPEGGERVGKWSGSMEVKSDGTFSFDDVPPGRYTVTAKQNPGRVRKGKDPNEKTIDIESGKTVEVEIEFK